jgi:hypothetical protein
MKKPPIEWEKTYPTFHLAEDTDYIKTQNVDGQAI